MSLNQSDLQDLISQVQAGRDQLARQVQIRTDKIAADQADTLAAQQKVLDDAQHRQNDLDALIASQQAAADAELAAEQAEIATNDQDIKDQQATLDLDAQGLAALDTALAQLNALLTNAPPAPVIPPVVVPPDVPPSTATSRVTQTTRSVNKR